MLEASPATSPDQGRPHPPVSPVGKGRTVTLGHRAGTPSVPTLFSTQGPIMVVSLLQAEEEKVNPWSRKAFVSSEKTGRTHDHPCIFNCYRSPWPRPQPPALAPARVLQPPQQAHMRTKQHAGAIFLGPLPRGGPLPVPGPARSASASFSAVGGAVGTTTRFPREGAISWGNSANSMFQTPKEVSSGSLSLDRVLSRDGQAFPTISAPAGPVASGPRCPRPSRSTGEPHLVARGQERGARTGPGAAGSWETLVRNREGLIGTPLRFRLLWCEGVPWGGRGTRVENNPPT